MPREIRCVMFGPSEACDMLGHFLVSRGDIGLGKEVERVVLSPGIEGVEARLNLKYNSTKPQLTLRSQELLAAMLLSCSKSRIPLPRGGIKSVEMVGDTLVLVIVTNRGVTEANPASDRKAAALAVSLAGGYVDAQANAAGRGESRVSRSVAAMRNSG